jgi:hypothetical protein
MLNDVMATGVSAGRRAQTEVDRSGLFTFRL